MSRWFKQRDYWSIEYSMEQSVGWPKTALLCDFGRWQSSLSRSDETRIREVEFYEQDNRIDKRSLKCVWRMWVSSFGMPIIIGNLANYNRPGLFYYLLLNTDEAMKRDVSRDCSMFLE